MILRDQKLSKWYFLFSTLWILIFSMFGIESAEGSTPTVDSNPILDTMYILLTPVILPIIYYNLYRKVKPWIVFLTTPFLGMAMEWLLFKPAAVLNDSSNLEATMFFAFIWAVILIFPYYFTIFADKSRQNLIITALSITVVFLIQILRVII